MGLTGCSRQPAAPAPPPGDDSPIPSGGLQRIVLLQGRTLPALALIDPDIVSRLVGWSADFPRYHPVEYQAWEQQFPALRELPTVGLGTAESFSLERLLTLRPDAVIVSQSTVDGLGIWRGSGKLMAQFKQLGIRLVVADFFLRPLETTVPSLRSLGHILDAQARAEEFIEFYEGRLAVIRERLSDDIKRPEVFVHAHAGSAECCNSPGVGTFDDFISFCGGHNLGREFLKTPTGQVPREVVVKRNPDVYIATGTGHGTGTGRMAIGYGVEARQTLDTGRAAIEGSGLSGLSAVREGRAHALWHGYNDTPAHVVALEAIARWLHPDLFADLDPAATLAQINQRFLTVPMHGTYFSDL